MQGRKIIRQVTAGRQLRLQDEHGNITTETLDGLHADDRQRLFVEGSHGIEPAMLWLSESGMPMRFDTWKMVFHEANQRCEAQGVGIYCHPHMLRHSFALRWWAVGVVRLLRRQNDLNARKVEFLDLWVVEFADPWERVRLLLGHRSVETTRNIYLQPALEVELDLMVDGDDGIGTRDEMLAFVARRSPRVQGSRRDVTR